jgi:hypothetical protein
MKLCLPDCLIVEVSGAPFWKSPIATLVPIPYVICDSITLFALRVKGMTAIPEEDLYKFEWQRLHGVDQARLNEACQQSHYAVQWLARAARAYVPSRPDDGHTSLGWDNDLSGFLTHRLRDTSTRLGLQIPTLTLVLDRGVGSSAVQTFALSGHSEGQVRQWLGEQFGVLGFVVLALDSPPPYEIPEHPIAQGAPYDVAGLGDALVELAVWYANGQVLLNGVYNQIIERLVTALPVRCWPHHFDLATQVTLPMKNAGTMGYIGAGLSPGDEYYQEPYFYVSIYPEPDSAALPVLPAIGHWHTHEFTAAVTPAHKIQLSKDPAAEISEFLQGAVAVALKFLGDPAK